MPVTAKWYGQGLKHLALGNVAWKETGGSAVMVMLCTSDYTPDQDAHEYLAHVTNEITGDGYTAGGKALALQDPVYDAAINETRLKAGETSWAAGPGGIQAKWAVIYVDTGVAATSPLLGYFDLQRGAPYNDPVEGPTAQDAEYKITWDAVGGVFKLTAA